VPIDSNELHRPPARYPGRKGNHALWSRSSLLTTAVSNLARGGKQSIRVATSGLPAATEQGGWSGPCQRQAVGRGAGASLRLSVAQIRPRACSGLHSLSGDFLLPFVGCPGPQLLAGFRWASSVSEAPGSARSIAESTSDETFQQSKLLNKYELGKLRLASRRLREASPTIWPVQLHPKTGCNRWDITDPDFPPGSGQSGRIKASLIALVHFASPHSNSESCQVQRPIRPTLRTATLSCIVGSGNLPARLGRQARA
jgi:hypothetical protein